MFDSNDTYSPTDYQWWKKNKSEYHSSIFPYLKRLQTQQSYRHSQNVTNMRLYGNLESNTLTTYNVMKGEPTSSASRNRITMNVVQSCIDTMVSKIVKNKPRPYFLTDGGDWSVKRKAEKLNQFVEGIFYSTKYYEKRQQAILDQGIFGDGVLKFYISENSDGKKEIKCERVLPDEIVVDDTEAFYGEPRQMHQLKWVHRDVLKQVFPGNDFIIDQAGAEDLSMRYYSDIARNPFMVMVVESWHLPSSEKAKDGVHCITIASKTLFSEPYKKDYFPFTFDKWAPRPVGFFAQGLAEQLTGLQVEINKILRTIQVSMHLVSVPKVFVEEGSKITSAHLDNKIGGIIRYAGRPPTPGQIGHIPPELFSHLQYLYQRAYEIVGISSLSANSAKPSGLDSGKALRTYNDIESERFMSVMKRYEQTTLDAARIFIDLAKEIAESDEYFVRVPGKKFLQTINWKDIDLTEEQYMMQVFPTNALSQEPSARLQEVQELMQAGLMSREDGLKLLDYPDLKSFYNRVNAGIDDVEKQLELMIDKGEYMSPEPYQNLQYAIPFMQSSYLQYRADGAPEENLELIRRWIDEADSMIKSAQAAAMAQQAPQGQAAPPVPQQASELVPQQSTVTQPIV